MMMGLFNVSGFVVNPNDMRALSQSEIQKRQYEQFNAMRNVAPSADGYLAAMNCFGGLERPAAEKPLDERFADFKVRLAAAIARRQ